jgi:tetratricopeptide (TPR) repeat protein
VAHNDNQVAEAAALTAQAAALAEAGGWPWALALLRYNHGAVLDALGRQAEAHSWLEASRQGFALLGSDWGQAVALVHLGLIAAREGDCGLALGLVDQALAMQRAEADVWGMAAALALHGQIAHRQGKLEAAAESFQACVTLIRNSVGDKATLAVALHGLGALEQAQAHSARAAPYLLAAAMLSDAINGATTISLVDRAALERDAAATRQVLDDAAYAAAWREAARLAGTSQPARTGNLAT